MQRTLGGNRLGSGNKMKVELKNYERSTHDLSYIWRSSASAGTLIPFLCKVALPGDTFDIKLNASTLTHPTVGPLFGSFKEQFDIFQAPIRLYNGIIHNNMLKIGLDMTQVILPQIVLPAIDLSTAPTDLNNSQINPSSLLAYLGIRGVGCNVSGDTVERSFNATSILALFDIYKNYYANKQEEIGAVIHSPSATGAITTITIVDANGGSHVITTTSTTPVTLSSGATITIAYSTRPDLNQVQLHTDEAGLMPILQLFQITNDSGTDLQGTYITSNGIKTTTYYQVAAGITPQVSTFDLNNIDNMREYILLNTSVNDPVIIAGTGSQAIEPYSWLVSGMINTQNCLPIKTYQSDLHNNWLNTTWINNINTLSAVQVVSGSFTIDALNIAKKVYELLNAVAVADGTYDSWIDVVYAHEHYMRCETPMYMGGMSKELIFQEVVSNSQTETQPLGSLAGRGTSTGHKGGNVTIKVDEPSYIIGLFSLTPRLDYSQGNAWDVNLKTLNDLHKPQLDQIGFQDLITEQLAWWDTTWNSTLNEWEQFSAGKQPAWLNYMTSVNETHGNFAIETNEMFMTLNRRYEAGNASGGTIKDLTTYIDPLKYNYIFAETALDAQNFWVQIQVDITARRKMSAKLMPNP